LPTLTAPIAQRGGELRQAGADILQAPLRNCRGIAVGIKTRIQRKQHITITLRQAQRGNPGVLHERLAGRRAADGFRRGRCIGAIHGDLACSQAHFAAEHEAHEVRAQCRGLAAAQPQQQPVIRQAQQRKPAAHTPLRRKPCAPLPASWVQRAQIAAELRLRECDGVRPAQFQHLCRQFDQHATLPQ
jgi:hypothetical protein